MKTPKDQESTSLNVGGSELGWPALLPPSNTSYSHCPACGEHLTHGNCLACNWPGEQKPASFRSSGPEVKPQDLLPCPFCESGLRLQPPDDCGTVAVHPDTGWEALDDYGCPLDDLGLTEADLRVWNRRSPRVDSQPSGERSLYDLVDDLQMAADHVEGPEGDHGFAVKLIDKVGGELMRRVQGAATHSVTKGSDAASGGGDGAAAGSGGALTGGAQERRNPGSGGGYSMPALATEPRGDASATPTSRSNPVS